MELGGTKEVPDRETPYGELTGAAAGENIGTDLTASFYELLINRRTNFTSIKLEHLNWAVTIESVRAFTFWWSIFLMPANKWHVGVREYPCAYFHHDIKLLVFHDQGHPHHRKPRDQTYRGPERSKVQRLHRAWPDEDLLLSWRRGGDPHPDGETFSWTQCVCREAQMWYLQRGVHGRGDREQRRWALICQELMESILRIKDIKETNALIFFYYSATVKIKQK